MPATAKTYVNGFVSQGLIFSQDNTFLTENSENGSLEFHELGLNLNYIASPKLRFSGQFLSQKVGDVVSGKPKLDYLLVDYGFYNTGLNRAGIRAGRVKTPYGFYNDSRDLPSARPGIIMPEAIYYEGLRDFMVSTDGLNLYSNHELSQGSLSLDAYIGKRNTENESSERFYLGYTSDQFDVDYFKKSGININFEPSNSNFQFNYSYLHLEPDFVLPTPIEIPNQQGTTSTLTDIEFDSRIHLLSLLYALPKHAFSMEYSDISNQGEFVVDNSPTKFSTSGEGYYAQWHWTPLYNLETWLRYSYYLGDKDGDESNTRNYSKISTAAVRWHYSPSLNLTTQYDLREGDGLVPIHEGYDRNDRNKYWSTLLLQLNYQFGF
ncbi:hypothetical protein J3998_12335 [Thiomicrorhabdus sp. 6S2-11]|uniref:Uncharacterized protein n=1 Tax=Thiomicrorhabdus marina TaxID=2818442 RepID=A0ABS3Q7P7_9GAMM|nr:hypothetical protein [Thiomicrorhabdus marina]MBO1928362.1 hypothetical protein [Thiomicrorhabdus marina]